MTGRGLAAALVVALLSLAGAMAVTARRRPGAYPLVDALEREFSTFDFEDSDALAPLVEYSLRNGTTAVVFGERCSPFQPPAACLVHDARKVQELGEAVFIICSRFPGAACTCRLDRGASWVTCLCNSDILGPDEQPAPPAAVPAAAPVEPNATAAAPSPAANATAQVAEPEVHVELPQVVAAPPPPPTADFGPDQQQGSCEDGCTGTDFGNYTFCYAHCMLNQSRAQRLVLEEQRDALQRQLDDVSHMLHKDAEEQLIDKMADELNVTMGNSTEASTATGASGAPAATGAPGAGPPAEDVAAALAEQEKNDPLWQQELQHLHGRVAAHLNHTEVELHRALASELYWMRVLGHHIEAGNLERERKMHLLHRTVFKQEHLAHLREALLREMLAKVGARAAPPHRRTARSVHARCAVLMCSCAHAPHSLRRSWATSKTSTLR